MGCGRKGNKAELLRFVVPQGGRIELDLKQDRPGRGGYLCPKEECLVRAFKKRRVSLRLRRDVRKDGASLLQEVREQLRLAVRDGVRMRRSNLESLFESMCRG